MNKIVTKIVSLIAALSIIVPVSFAPSTALAATTLFSDGFGTVNSFDVTGWDNNNPEEIAGSSSGEDITRTGASSNKFAKLGNGGWIRQTINATGYNNLKLHYYWNGDQDADGSSDQGRVQYCVGASCTSFTTLQNDEIDQTADNRWATHGEQIINIPAGANNTTFRIRFWNDSNQSNEFYRIDDVSVVGDALPVEYTLTVSKVGTGTGTVTSDFPADINCGADCSDPFTSGSVVELFQTADPGSVFAGWSGACTGTGSCFVTMNAAKSVTATFNLIPEYTLTVSKAGTGTGYVRSDFLTDIDCGADCSDPFTEGALVELFQTADPGSTFTGWSGACTGTGSCFVTMDAAKSVTATFDITAPTTGTLTLVKHVTSGSGNFDFNVINGSETIVASSNITASAGDDGSTSGISLTPGTYAAFEVYEEGWTFNGATCTDGESSVGTATEAGIYNITVDAGDNITCTFTNSPIVEPTPTVTVTIVKFVDGVHATAESANSASFLMSSSWNAENIGAGSGTYNLSTAGFNTDNAYEAVTSEMTAGANYATNEEYNEVVASACVESEVPVPFALLGYTVGNTLEEAAGMEPSMTAPSLTNITNNKYIIVWNDNCSTEEGGGGDDSNEASIWISKQTVGGIGTFNFNLSGSGVDEDDQEFSLTTNSSEPEGDIFTVNPSDDNSNYTITEDVPLGWELTGVSCEAEAWYQLEEGNGVTVVVDPDDTANCVFTNTATAGVLTVIKHVINDDGETSVASQFGIKVANEGDLLEFNGSESGTDLLLKAGTFTVTENENSSYTTTYSGDCDGSIALGEHKTCTITNDDIENEDGTSSGSEANEDGNTEGSVLGASIDTEGSVLGALSCSFLTYEQLITIKDGKNADPEIVKALQEWLNSSQNAGLTVNGIYDEPTKFAIMLLQEKYASEVLSPWGIEKATGNVWKTTAKLIMKLVCGENVEIGALVPFEVQ